MKEAIIVNIAAWWPTEEKPGNGLFIYEHIKSTSAKQPIVVFLRTEQIRIGKPSIKIEKRHESLSEYLVVVNTPIRRFGLLESMIKSGFEKALAEVANDHGQIDLIHFHVRDHVTKHGIEMMDALGIPHMLTEHFSFYHRGIHLLKEKEKQLEEEKIKSWFGSPNLRQIITVSREMASILTENFGAPEEKMHVVRNIASDEFAYEAKSLAGETRIALVAGWRPPKNPLLFFEAVSTLDEEQRQSLQIDFVGHGEQVEEVRRYVDSNLGDMKIFIHGFLPKSEASTLVQKAHFLVHPTDQENLPTIIAEALCCGTPVLSMNVNGIPEMVDSTNGILVEPKRVSALASGIREMIDNRSNFNHEQIAKAASSKYSAQSVGAQLDSIIQLALSE